MSYQHPAIKNEQSEKENPPTNPLERIKNSPLSKLNPPLKLNPTLRPTSSSCPLSSSSYRRARKDLARIVTYVMERDLTSIERACRILMDELHNLQSAGYEYLIDMQEGD